MAITKEVLDELLKEYKGPDDFYGPDGLIKQLSKALIERAMQAELTEQIGYEKNEVGEKQSGNRRNGKSTKTLRTDQGPMEIAVPRDRDGEYDPQIIAKHHGQQSCHGMARVRRENHGDVQPWDDNSGDTGNHQGNL
jgi:transposase-like protein